MFQCMWFFRIIIQYSIIVNNDAPKSEDKLFVFVGLSPVITFSVMDMLKKFVFVFSKVCHLKMLWILTGVDWLKLKLNINTIHLVCWTSPYLHSENLFNSGLLMVKLLNFFRIDPFTISQNRLLVTVSHTSQFSATFFLTKKQNTGLYRNIG